MEVTEVKKPLYTCELSDKTPINCAYLLAIYYQVKAERKAEKHKELSKSTQKDI
jgi:hypothetical protein